MLYNNTCSFCIFIGRELCVIKVHTHGWRQLMAWSNLAHLFRGFSHDFCQLYYNIKQIDFIFLCCCTVIDHRWRHSVWRTKSHGTRLRLVRTFVLHTLWRHLWSITVTDLNYWIKLLSCIIEANGGHIGLSHINLRWYYWGSRRGFYRFRLLVGMDKHCVNEISFTNNFCFFLNLPVNNELGIVQDGRHEFIIKCFKPSQNH